MAEEQDAGSKTEPPSPRKREQAHEQGQFAHSQDLVSGLVLFVGVAGLLYLAHELGGGLLRQTRLDLAHLPWSDLSIEAVQQLFTGKLVHGAVDRRIAHRRAFCRNYHRQRGPDRLAFQHRSTRNELGSHRPLSFRSLAGLEQADARRHSAAQDDGGRRRGLVDPEPARPRDRACERDQPDFHADA